MLHRLTNPPVCIQPPFMFAISRNGRDEYEYIEGDKRLMFNAEMLVGPIHRDLYVDSIQQWLPPHEQDEITNAGRERILQNICTYFNRNHVTYRIRR